MHELREALAWATEDEREGLIELLFRSRLNPLDYVQTPTPEAVGALPAVLQQRAIEERFRFLAADGLTVLRGRTQTLSYRSLLLDTCRYLKISYAENFSTEDLEAELFLNVLQATLKKLPPEERSRLGQTLDESLRQVSTYPLQNGAEQRSLENWLRSDKLRLLLEGGSAVAISTVIRPLVLKHLARQVMFYAAQRQVARELLKQGGAAATRLQSFAAAQLAGRGVALNLARYGTARTLLGALGPALWVWFLADLGWRAIATNRGRVIPALFLLAQIRLTRIETCGDYSQPIGA